VRCLPEAHVVFPVALESFAQLGCVESFQLLFRPCLCTLGILFISPSSRSQSREYANWEKAMGCVESLAVSRKEMIIFIFSVSRMKTKGYTFVS
jgi:hypothetical protein